MNAFGRHAVKARGFEKTRTVRMESHEVVSVVVAQDEDHVPGSIRRVQTLRAFLP
jgi:hypothetical protein